MRTKLILAALLLLWMPASDLAAQDIQTIQGHLRTETSIYTNLHHVSMGAADPGASGATWTDPDANTIGGWFLNAVGETLEFSADVHANWDGATDLTVEVCFAVSDAATNPGDTVDLVLVSYYNAHGDVATKTQSEEIATATDGTQWTVYVVEFTINYDEAGNLVEAGDEFTFVLHMETDTSEVDDVIIRLGGNLIYYMTTHVGFEDGDT